MPAIGLIDDTVDWTQHSVPTMNLVLKKNGYVGWSVETTPPFIEMEHSLRWINEHEVRALLVDQRLLEGQAAGGKGHVAYLGHELVSYLRRHLKELPIYIISSFGLDDVTIQDRFKDVEDFIVRDALQEKLTEYTLRFARAGQSFVTTFEKDLAALSEGTSKIVLGNAKPEDLKRVHAIRQKLSLSIPTGVPDRSQELAALGQRIEKLDKLRVEFEALQKKPQTKGPSKAKGKAKGRPEK